jgi:5-methylcytosine-specific restriction endonuclease McrA
MIKKICVCGKKFEVYPYRENTAVFCSNACQKKYRKFPVGFKNPKGSLAKMGNKNPAYGKYGELAGRWKHGLSKTKEYSAFLHRRWKASKKRNGGTHTLQEWKDLKEQYSYMCVCCKKLEPSVTLTEDHIIPLTWGGRDSIDNIQPLCASCNARKGNRNNNNFKTDKE